MLSFKYTKNREKAEDVFNEISIETVKDTVVRYIMKVTLTYQSDGVGQNAFAICNGKLTRSFQKINQKLKADIKSAEFFSDYEKQVFGGSSLEVKLEQTTTAVCDSNTDKSTVYVCVSYDKRYMSGMLSAVQEIFSLPETVIQDAFDIMALDRELKSKEISEKSEVQLSTLFKEISALKSRVAALEKHCNLNETTSEQFETGPAILHMASSASANQDLDKTREGLFEYDADGRNPKRRRYYTNT